AALSSSIAPRVIAVTLTSMDSTTYLASTALLLRRTTKLWPKLRGRWDENGLGSGATPTQWCLQTPAPRRFQISFLAATRPTDLACPTKNSRMNSAEWRAVLPRW